MTLADYNRLIKKLRWPYGLVMFGVLIPGMAGVLYLTNRLAESSSWDREWVFLSMLPTLVTPVFAAVSVTELLDKRIGLKCTCGQSLSCGGHVRRLMKEGGQCPACGKVVVEPGSAVEQ